MRKLLLIIITLVCALSLGAQTNISRPSWLTRLPRTPRNAMYYYRVTTAEARTYEQAYAKAFATAIQESRWKLGVAVNINTSEEEQAQDIINNINSIGNFYNYPVDVRAFEKGRSTKRFCF